MIPIVYNKMIVLFWVLPNCNLIIIHQIYNHLGLMDLGGCRGGCRGGFGAPIGGGIIRGGPIMFGGGILLGIC